MKYDNYAHNLSNISKKAFQEKSDLDCIAEDIALSLREFNELIDSKSFDFSIEAGILSKLSNAMLDGLKDS